GGEELKVERLGVLLELLILALAELERLAMRAVGRRVRILGVVHRVVERFGVQAPVVTLLQLDRAHARVLRGLEQLFTGLDVALMVVPDLGDHETVRRVLPDAMLPDGDFFGHPYLATKWLWPIPTRVRGSSAHEYVVRDRTRGMLRLTQYS